MLAAIGISAIAGRLLSGYLLDRFFAPYLAAAVFFVALLGTALLLTNVITPFATFVAAVCLGFGLGAEVDIIGYLTGRYFAFRRYGEICGYIFAAFTVGSGVGPLIMGTSFDLTGNYNGALVEFVVALLISIGLISQLGPYRYYAQGRPPAPHTPGSLPEAQPC